MIKFHKEKEFDSTYIYTGKLLLNSEGELKDYLNYLQGIASINRAMYTKALMNFKDISNATFINNLKLLKLADCYLYTGDYEKAINNYLEWEKGSRFKGVALKAQVYHNMGICYIHLKDFSKAKSYFDKKLSLINKENKLAIISFKMDLANVYYGQYLDKKAIPLFIEAYKLAKIHNNYEWKKLTSQNMAIVEKNRGNYEASVKYFEEYDKWKDSLFNRDKIWELTEKDKQIAVAQKQSEIALQDEQIKRQQVVQKGLLTGGAVLVAFLSVLGLFYKKLKTKNILITQQKEDLATANKTKDYLFSVVSHDLRSPMNTIKYQHQQLQKHITNKDLNAIAETNTKVLSVTDSTSRLLNNVLHWSLEQSNQMVFSVKEFPLVTLIQHVLFDYTNLIETNHLEISTQFSENFLVNIDKESVKVVLRNILDNAVKYAKASGEIEISTLQEENFGVIQVSDNGQGIPPEKLQKINELKEADIDKVNRSEGIGLGMVLCHSLVKKNQGKLIFDSEEGKGTTVKICLPLA